MPVNANTQFLDVEFPKPVRLWLAKYAIVPQMFNNAKLSHQRLVGF